ncbi:MAG: C-terminal binding protein [Nitrospinae bacterium]|nr:C-terminal binding protein [Nitrospinota bacterium]
MSPPAKDGPLIAVAGTRFGPPTIEEEILSPLGPRLRLGMGADSDSLLELCAEAEGVIIGAIPKFTAEVIAQLKHCKIFARGGVGVDNIDLDAARERGIQVTSVPDYCVDEVSDHAMALILYYARKIEGGIAEVKTGGWGIAALRPIAPLRGATLGVVGIGRIGAALAGKARAFGMRLIAHDPFAADSAFEKLGAENAALSRIWEESDYISLHAPLTPETRGMVNAEALERMKTDAVLINVARGELVNEKALAAALKRNAIRGAGLDVLEQEPPRPNHPLLALPNCRVTPHSAWYSTAALEDMRRKAAADVLRVLQGEEPRYPVG